MDPLVIATAQGIQDLLDAYEEANRKWQQNFNPADWGSAMNLATAFHTEAMTAVRIMATAILQLKEENPHV